MVSLKRSHILNVSSLTFQSRINFLVFRLGCSRNQYECRTSGDCIAIYNVCDGIPQCADGSDEATELGCPTEKPPIPSSPPVIHGGLHDRLPQSPEVLKYPQPIISHHKSLYPPIYANEQEIPRKLWPVPVDSAHEVIDRPQQVNLQYPVQQQAGIMNIPQMNYGSQGYIGGGGGGWDYRQIYEHNKEAYNSANQLHTKNELPMPYERK